MMIKISRDLWVNPDHIESIRDVTPSPTITGGRPDPVTRRTEVGMVSGSDHVLRRDVQDVLFQLGVSPE